MQGVTELSTVAFLSLFLVFLFRARNAFRAPEARLSWLATGVGALAMFAQGSVVPLRVLDAWIGGSNLINLVQNVLAVASFWLVKQAVSSTERALGKQRWAPLFGGISAFSFAFFFIDRSPTATDFIVAHSEQFPLFVYASVYMGMVAVICCSLVQKIWRGHTATQLALTCGALLVSIASVIEILFLASKCFRWWPEPVSYTFGLLFDPLFYGGVLLISLCMASWALQRAVRSWRVKSATQALDEMFIARGLLLGGEVLPVSKPVTESGSLTLLYERIIAAHDYARVVPTAFEDDDWQILSRASELVIAGAPARFSSLQFSPGVSEQ